MFLSAHKKKKRKWPFMVGGGLVIVALLSAGAFLFARNIASRPYIAEKIIEKYTAPKNSDLFKLVPQVLGFNSPKTYLILLSNNTELRPAGGFIGSYAIVHVENGSVDVEVIEGTETLDKKTPKDFKIEPPAPLTDHLGVDRWYFRDSNWDPDFTESAKQGLILYKGEGGVAADQINAVIQVTPTVVERLLELTGPITVQGITFTPENITERLEHEVEYAYYDKGISFENRKQLLRPFMTELLRHLKSGMFTQYDDYIQAFVSLAQEKQILVNVLQEGSLQDAIQAFGWDGKMQNADGDYLMWVDANLAALKTDHAMDRSLTYVIKKRADGRYIATARMHYAHGGTFDWRTTRYLSYVRVFVPKDAELVSVSGAGKGGATHNADTIQEGKKHPVELAHGVLRDKQWFGAFISIEPGQTRDVEFTYILPDKISKYIDTKLYTLFVQKQAGTIAHGLTLDLNFDTTITSAEPAEAEEFWGNSAYTLKTDLLLDRAFKVMFY